MRRLFRLLGLVPGPDVTEHAAAALAHTDPATAARLIDRLAAAHLIEEHTAGRCTFHDLPRLFAAERARAEDCAAERRAATERLLGHYLRVVDVAAGRLWANRLRIDPATRPGEVPHHPPARNHSGTPPRPVPVPDRTECRSGSCCRQLFEWDGPKNSISAIATCFFPEAA